ncbi:TAXI family TRAP transporter solute-binding subunit [Bacillaceae bacterium IKA-2]|nr:TAXI family TRAP transporter solute-binding subunit [Bacillaceae bacterium IKA-2]
MTKFKRTLFTVAAGVSLLFAAACGGSDDPANNEPAPDNDSEQEAKSADYPTTVVIGTASQGGLYYIYGGGLGELVNRELSVTSNVEVSGGPVHNMQLVNTGDYDIGFATLGPAYEGFMGEGEWTNGQKLEDVRIAFPMYTTPFHWWSVDSDINSIDDIVSENINRIGVGPAGGTSGTYLPLIHELLGIDATSVQAGASDMTGQQMDGGLDTIGFAAGVPIPAVQEVLATSRNPVNLFGISGAQRDLVIENFPYFDAFTMPGETYEGIAEEIETIAMFNFGIVNVNADEQFVYDLVKAYHENIDSMIITASAAREALPEAILKNTVVPLHPGAIRYYEEIGIDLPDAVK